MEIWKTLNANAELKDNVEISNKGNLRKVTSDGKHYFYRPAVNSRGYISVLLYNNENVRKNFTLHRLLMLTFVGGGEGMVINHKDGNRLNNDLDNLEWVTRSQNCQHSKSIDGYKRVRDLSDEEILNIINEYIGQPINLNDLAKKHNVTRETMRTIINVRGKKLLAIEDYEKIRKIHLDN